MANPQLEDGYTPIANEIAEALMRINLSAYESRVLWYLFRKTYGWGKKTDWISLSQFSKCIGIDRRLVHRAIKQLSSKEMIVIERDDSQRVRYGFNKHYDKWNLSSKEMTVINRDDTLSSKEMTQLSSIQIPTKETITKETITKEKTHTSVPKKTDRETCPHQEIIALYREILPELPTVAKWTDRRHAYLKTCWADKSRQHIAWWRKYFEGVRESDFLMGRKGDFACNLEWLTKESNLIKVLEGNYKNREGVANAGNNTGKFYGRSERIERITGAAGSQRSDDPEIEAIKERAKRRAIEKGLWPPSG